ncbi:MAG TPA: carboxypeptidase-like regulatory domain-containing protein [Candidatus Acidoferrales bacterium]|nr:carboxypeptidase-like regulatory domain-containing protein [Candidatus Acidoferrales bacterium]
MRSVALLLPFALAAAFEQQPLLQEERGRIEGRVLSAVTGEPLNKASIMLQHNGPSVDESVSATSDPQGYFSFSDVTPGSYFLRAQRNGFLAAQYGAQTTGTLGTVLKVAAGQTIKGVMTVLIPAAVITGRVLDGDGDPLPFARAQLMRYAYYGIHRQLEVLFGAETNELGEYHIFGVAPGRYFLKASHSGPVNIPGEEYIPVYYPNASDAGVASQMQVSAGSQIRGIDLKLVKAQTFRISGRVERSAANRPMPFFSLTITPRHSDWMDPGFMKPIEKSGSLSQSGRIAGRRWNLGDTE